MVKRGLGFESDSPDRPFKRRQLFTPNPPFPSGSSSPLRSSVSVSSRNTTPYSVPTDSPTNPFGRRRVQNLELPRPTSFAKHLPLRCQLVETYSEAPEEGGIFRIVQVPLNYSFKHLHRLLLWLFGGHTVCTVGAAAKRKLARPLKGMFDIQRNTSRKGRPPAPSTASSEKGHLFEVEKNIVMYSDMTRPGEIRSSTTWAKLSSARDPHVRPGDKMREASLEAALDEEEVSTWRWEGEEEWTVSQAWPDGGDLSRGIIYHHSSRLSIHITVNTIKIPSRKGVSNEPYVFCARGPYSLPPLQTASVPLFPPNPAPLFPPTGLFPNSKPRKPLSNAQSANTDIADEESDMEIDIEASQLNAPDAFGKFLRRTPIPLVDDDSSDEEEPNFRSSSPTFPSSDGLPFPPPMITPFPTRRAHVLRVEHASRRMEKLVRKGLKELDDDKVWNEVTQDDEVPANQLEEELEEELAQVLEPDHVNVEGYGGEPVDEEGAEDEEDENYRPRTRTKVGSPDYEEEE